MCPSRYREGGSLLHCPSTLTGKIPAVYFCCTGLGVTSTGRYPASCPVKPGLSSPDTFRHCQPRSFILLTGSFYHRWVDESNRKWKSDRSLGIPLQKQRGLHSASVGAKRVPLAHSTLAGQGKAELLRIFISKTDSILLDNRFRYVRILSGFPADPPITTTPSVRRLSILQGSESLPPDP